MNDEDEDLIKKINKNLPFSGYLMRKKGRKVGDFVGDF